MKMFNFLFVLSLVSLLGNVQAKEIELNYENCVTDGFSNLSTDISNEILDYSGESMFAVCTPVGLLQKSILGNDIISASEDVHIVKIKSHDNLTDKTSIKGVPNLLVFYKDSKTKANLRGLVARGKFKIKVIEESDSCHQETGLICPEYFVDQCFLPESKPDDKHLCVLEK